MSNELTLQATFMLFILNLLEYTSFLTHRNAYAAVLEKSLISFSWHFMKCSFIKNEICLISLILILIQAFKASSLVNISRFTLSLFTFISFEEVISLRFDSFWKEWLVGIFHKTFLVFLIKILPFSFINSLLIFTLKKIYLALK